LFGVSIATAATPAISRLVAEQDGPEPDAEPQHPHAEGARHEVMAGLVNDHQESEPEDREHDGECAHGENALMGRTSDITFGGLARHVGGGGASGALVCADQGR